jgi:NADH:ubiquinone oxidoreductase subunit F (NADH-binding)
VTPAAPAPAPRRRSHPAGPTALPRLLLGGPGRDAHLATYGPVPPTGPALVDAVAAAGLRGRGGAGFPTARKLRAVASGRGGAVVVANGTEGEPLSSKDKALLVGHPHLVIDGLCAAADAVGAGRRILAIEDGHPDVEAAVTAAVGARPADGVEIVVTPRRYVSGQETALVDLVGGGPGRPTAHRPFERGVDGRPTLVDNVETLAQVALIARYGADWYREVGTPDEPGSLLVTVAGAVARPGVYEVAHGHGVGDLLDHAGAGAPRAVLFGGYYGRWLPAAAATGARLARASLAPLGADLGCGVLAVLPDGVCALDEVARVAAWYAAASAGQCGTCRWGLRDLAGAASALATAGGGRAATGATCDATVVDDLWRWTAMVDGRGGCRLPDGAATFIRSALDVFADEVDDHRRGACRRTHTPILPTPAPEPW